MYEDFLKEKQYISNVSPRTLEWFNQALAWWDGNPKTTVIKMREAGLSARSINSYRTAINSYLHWNTGIEEKCHPGCKHPRIPRMKDDEKVLATYQADGIKEFVRFKPKNRVQRRLQTLVLALTDTGCRILELLNLKWTDVNFNDLLITVRGKGGKFRMIPFSLELRKHLFKLQKESKHPLVFCTRDGGMLGRRNMLRDLKVLCKQLNVKVPERGIHALRHTYAINAIRRGASVFHVQRQLGHSTLEMTKKYVNLVVDDLSKMHQQVSLLS
jgi:integrase/recombinase XerD